MKKALALILALVILIGILPMNVFATEAPTAKAQNVNLENLYSSITVRKGTLATSYDGSIVDSDIYGVVVNYQLKKGRTLTISNTDYVFSVRKLVGGNYSTMLKQATTDSFTATEDMTVAMLIRKPDKSTVTAKELSNIFIYDCLFGLGGVDGYAHRFTVEAKTIEGGTHTTRSAIFLPKSYSNSGSPTRLIMLTHGFSAYLSDSVWYGNADYNTRMVDNYLKSGYAVFVVDNTAASTASTPDLGCPQLVDSYYKAYQYVTSKLNLEKQISIHSRSFGTFAAIRFMREHPSLVKCALMTGPRVSIKWAFDRVDKKFVANRFGFTNTSGSTYEADKFIGYDPYTDVNGKNYSLPPTFWMISNGDYTEDPLYVIQKLKEHGNNITSKIYTGIDHTHVCALDSAEMVSDAMTFLAKYQTQNQTQNQTQTHTHSYTAVVTPPTSTKQGYTTYTCACGNSYVSDYKEPNDKVSSVDNITSSDIVTSNDELVSNISSDLDNTLSDNSIAGFAESSNSGNIIIWIIVLIAISGVAVGVILIVKKKKK